MAGEYEELGSTLTLTLSQGERGSVRGQEPGLVMHLVHNVHKENGGQNVVSAIVAMG